MITGGVLSGLGKGVAIASIGNLLSSQYKVIPIKCDGYLNVDPGTMNPVEHGEVFVLDDGGEVDMDFGHYERFLGINCKSDWNITMGKVFQNVRLKERRGDYLGKTVQMIPHVSDFISEYYIKKSIEADSDVTLIEIGGTVGDMENELYIEAVKTLASRVGKENVIYVHLTYVPIPSGVDEQKSKPTQQSIGMLMQRGIHPDMVVARCSEWLNDSVKGKISSFCNISAENIFTGIDVDDIYKIPIVFEEQGMAKTLSKLLNIPVEPKMDAWKKLVANKKAHKHEINVAIAGKYTALEDSYASIVEALNHCAAHARAKINLKWIETTDESLIEPQMSGIDAVIVPGGFGSRGTEGKIKVIQYCRENHVPFLGICYGLQMAVVEFARNVCGLKDVNSTEINPECKVPIVDILEEQRDVTDKGGTMRLGSYVAHIGEDTLVNSLYDSQKVFERHRHRYEVNPRYHQILESTGLKLSGLSPSGTLAEFIELKKHPYFVATQAHPELKSSLLKPAPLFLGLIKAGLKNKTN